MSRLVPEKRTDRNGRLVTRHVKDGGDNRTTPTPSIPAPAASAPVAQPLTKRVQAAIEDLTNLLVPYYDDATRREWAKHVRLHEHSGQVISYARDIAQRYGWSSAVMNAVREVLSMNPENELMRLEALGYTPVEAHFERTGGDTDVMHYRWIGELAAEVVVPAREWDQELTTDERIRSAAAAHIICALQIRAEQGLNAVRVDYASAYADLLALAMQHPERADELGTFVLERGGDAELARLFLEQNGESPALSSGIL